MESEDRATLKASCRFCLEKGTLKEMWSEQWVGDDRKIYGKMLADCYSITLRPLSDLEYICLECIKMMHTAIKLKDMILRSKQILLQHLSEQNQKYEIKHEICYINDIDEVNMSQNDELNHCPSSIKSDIEEEKDNEVVEYLNIEYLDDAEIAGSVIDGDDGDTIEEKLPERRKQVDSKKEVLKKSEKSARPTIYKKYTDNDLIECVTAFKNRGMSRTEASKMYNVPFQTLCNKLRDKKFMKNIKVVDEDESNTNLGKHNRFLQEIKKVLEFTNATLHKAKLGKYFCPYCRHKPLTFEPDALRLHVKTKHAKDRITAIGKILRPARLNEVVKIDIENLQCTFCNINIDTWNNMFEHLQEHDVEFEECYSRLIPYKITKDLKCALCEQNFLNYQILDAHMNAHYNNYICDDCGDTFLSEKRFKKHVETHSTARFPCPYCDKVFSLERYKKKHVDGIHKPEGRFKCYHCDEKFRYEYLRHSHMLKEHKEKVQSINCELCHSTFSWRPYYLKHMRTKHGKKEKEYKCLKCNKEFRMKSQLRNHEKWHKGDNKYVCAICKKKFMSTQYLQRHYRKHVEVITAEVK